MEWFRQWFGEEYLFVYEHRNLAEAERDVLFLEHAMHLRGGERVLDLCSGQGRHALPLAERGYRVIGLDYSLPLLHIAHDALEPDSLNPSYVRADAREIPFRDGTFDVVLSLFTSFGYFEDGENLGFLRSMARLLTGKGKYYIDYLNPPRLIADLVPETIRVKNGITIIEQRALDEESQRVEKTIILRNGKEEQTFRESVRLYTLAELRKMLEIVGLAIERVYGSTAGEEYDETSSRMILWGRKNI